MSCPIDTALGTLPTAPLWVAFSGGRDSTVLLHALARRRPAGLGALHVDHGLHADSAVWAEHCRRLAQSWGVPCQVLRVEVPPGGSREEAARQARYQAFATFLPPGAVLVLAHHQDDQAETVLLRLLRGAGGRGLAAMREWSLGPGGIQLWRPLLRLPRRALEEYAHSHRLPTLDDPMNHDPRFDRTFLRREVLPLLTRRWPRAVAALARSAFVLASEDGLRENLVRRALADCQGLDPHGLLVEPLANLDPALRQPVIERWLAEIGAPPLPGPLRARLAAGLPARSDRGAPALRFGGWCFERYRGELHAEPERAWAETCAEWDGARPLAWCGGRLELLGAPSLPWRARVTLREGGERLRHSGRMHDQTLKDCLQTLGVPPWERRRLPLLWAPNGRLAAVADLLYTDEFDAWLEQNGARLRWTPVERAPSVPPQAC